MSDITHARRAAELLDSYERTNREVGPDPALLMEAGVQASLAGAKALRELDVTIRQRLAAIEKSVGRPEQTWLQWQDGDGYQSIPVSRIVRIKQDGDGTVVVTHDGEISTTLSFVQASLQVGAE